jgi:hypothetical protein
MARLCGKIIKGKEFKAFEFSDDIFKKYFGNESEGLPIFIKGLKKFDIKSDVKPNKKNEFIMVVSDKDTIVYGYFNTKEIEEGYYDREDFTDWVKSDFGIKNLKSAKEILENL